MKEEIITVVILEGGKTCKEVNYLSLPKEKDYQRNNKFEIADKYKNDFYKWQQAQSKLRTFEIENWIAPVNRKLMEEKFQSDWQKPGSTHQAVVVNDKTVRII